MKKILCTLLACTLCASVAVGISGCGCSSNNMGQGSQTPGYKVEATEPDIKNGNFNFFILNKTDIMLTAYTGSDKVVKIPDTYENYKVTVVGRSVFRDMNIDRIEVPETVTEIQDYAFSSRNIKEVKLPSNLKIIRTKAFLYCAALESIELPASLKELGDYAFSGSGLKSITIPESKTLTMLGQFAFYQCPELKEVNLPATITSIPDNTFSDCPNKITIIAPSSSYSQNYAKTHNIEFKAVK